MASKQAASIPATYLSYAGSESDVILFIMWMLISIWAKVYMSRVTSCHVSWWLGAHSTTQPTFMLVNDTTGKHKWTMHDSVAVDALSTTLA